MGDELKRDVPLPQPGRRNILITSALFAKVLLRVRVNAEEGSGLAFRTVAKSSFVVFGRVHKA